MKQVDVRMVIELTLHICNYDPLSISVRLSFWLVIVLKSEGVDTYEETTLVSSLFPLGFLVVSFLRNAKKLLFPHVFLAIDSSDTGS